MDSTSGELRFGCHNFQFGFPDCNKTHVEPVRFCCNSYDFCNEDLVQFLSIATTEATTEATTQATTFPPVEAITRPPQGMAKYNPRD